MLSAPLFNFDDRAGGSDWRKAVAGYYAARETYVLTMANPQDWEPPPPRPTGQVIDLAAWRAAVAAERSPLELAAEAYRVAAMRLLMTWAPSSQELREQMRLAATVAGWDDPTFFQPSTRDPAKQQATPSEILRLLYNSSLGLIQGERDAQAAGGAQ
jgi:hypothetical protein